MKKLLSVLVVVMLICLTGCSDNDTKQTNGSLIEEVKDVTVPEFKIKICGAKISNEDLKDCPLYKTHASSINSSGTAHEVDYVGYKLKDLFEIIQVSASGPAAIICTDGYTMNYDGDLNAEDLLIAITKDGEAFKDGPWFAPCSSKTTGDYAQDLEKIEIGDIYSPLAGKEKEEKEQKDTEQIVFPQDPISEDKTDKITFGAFSFKINGKEITNADLDGLKIYRNTVVTKNSKDFVSQSKYSGYVLKDVLAKLNITGNKVKAIASDGYENELDIKYLDDPLTIIAIEKDKEVGKDGTVWLAPCSDNVSSSYAKEVIELIVE